MTNIEITPPSKHPGLRIQGWSDNQHAHWLLNAQRFDHRNHMLDLMLKYNGACTVMEKCGADPTIKCSMSCAECQYSIYHQIDVQERQFRRQGEILCKRIPKVGDEWELSIVYRAPKQPKYITIHWECVDNEPDTPVLDVILDTVQEYDPKLMQNAQLQYVKILRFDAEKAMDVSFIANPILKEMCLARGMLI